MHSEGRGPQISVVFGDMKKKAHSAFYSRFHRASGLVRTRIRRTTTASSAKAPVHDFGAGSAEGSPLGPGGHWFQPGNVPQDNHCASTTPCVMFIYTPHGFDFIPVKGPS